MSEHLHLDPDLTARAKKLFRELGLDLNTAIHLFLLQSLRENALPFTLRLTTAASPSSDKSTHDAANSETAPSVDAVDENHSSSISALELESEDDLEGQSFAPAEHPANPSQTEEAAPRQEEQLSGIRQAFYDMGLLGMPLHRVRTLNQIYAIGEPNPHVQGWRETYVSGDETFALDFGVVRVELGYRNGGSLRMMDGRLPDEVLEADAVYPRDLSAVFSNIVGQNLTDVNTVRVRHERGESEQLRLRFANDCTLVFSPENEWAALWLCDSHGAIMFAPEAVWRRSLGERTWLALR